jgi:hypothetical protein
VLLQFEDICEAVEVSRAVRNPYRTIIKRRYWPQLTLSILIPMFQQLTGINAIMFYAPQLFQAAGQGADDALLSTVITGVSCTLLTSELSDTHCLPSFHQIIPARCCEFLLCQHVHVCIPTCEP